jgi:hypothetical protein
MNEQTLRDLIREREVEVPYQHLLDADAANVVIEGGVDGWAAVLAEHEVAPADHLRVEGPGMLETIAMLAVAFVERDAPPPTRGSYLSPEQWQGVAEFLFDRLDDIDTADDAAKDNDASYRMMVRGIQRRRHEVADVGLEEGEPLTFHWPPGVGLDSSPRTPAGDRAERRLDLAGEAVSEAVASLRRVSEVGATRHTHVWAGEGAEGERRRWKCQACGSDGGDVRFDQGPPPS